MVQIDFRSVRSRMAARPRPRFSNELRLYQILAVAHITVSVALSAVQVSVDASDGGVRVACDQIAGHEAGGVVRGVLAAPEAVDAFVDVLAAQIRVVAGDALALDDRVRVVFSETVEDIDRLNRDVGPAIGSQDIATGTGFRAGLHDQGPAPRQSVEIESVPHPVAQAFVHLHFSRVGVDVREAGRPRPTRVDGSQNCSRSIGAEIDERPSGDGRSVMRELHAAGPAKLSATTASASSRADTPIQCRRAAGLMTTTSLRP